jgi:uncharacterized protein (TIGR03663 family)
VEQTDELRSRAWWTAIVYLAAAAIVLRFYDLDLKPLHHDEGVNTLFLTRLVEPPHSYQYDPANYHGPTLYYFAWLSAAIAGLTTETIRAVTASAGVLAVMLLLPLRRQIGSAGALAASSLLALSPGAVYFSRYFIHEMLLVCFTLGTVVAAALWWQRGRALYLYLAAASAALATATKETSIVSAAVLIGAPVGAALLCGLRRGGAGAARGDLSEVLRRLGGSGGVLLTAAGIFCIVNLIFYTSLFTHWDGALDAVKAFAIWTKTGTTAHTRPWHAYVGWLSQEELPLLVVGTAGAIAALWRLDNRFAVLAALWAAGTLTAYSVIPYKTPWLALNVVAPLAICGGYAFDRMWRGRRRLPRAVAAMAAVAVAGAAAVQAVRLNFVEYDDGRHPYVYVHTSREVLELVREIHRIEALNPGASIAVTSRDHFPLSWYLRAYRAGYYGAPVVTNDPLVIASEEQQPALAASLGGRYEQAGSYRLRPGVQLVLYVRRDLRHAPSDSPP